MIVLPVKKMRARMSCDFPTIPQLAQGAGLDILLQAHVLGDLSLMVLPYEDCVKKVELSESLVREVKRWSECLYFMFIY